MVLADHQTAGRGQHGRPWTAPAGAALLFSVVLRPPLPVARWPEIPLAAGCAVAEGLETVAPVTATLKWPNDVLVGGRKLAGILAEGVAGAPPLVILGIGVNVSQQESDWPPDLAGTAGSLAGLGAAVAREAAPGGASRQPRRLVRRAARGGLRAGARRLAPARPPRPSASRCPAARARPSISGPGGELVVRRTTGS